MVPLCGTLWHCRQSLIRICRDRKYLHYMFQHFPRKGTVGLWISWLWSFTNTSAFFEANPWFLAIAFNWKRGQIQIYRVSQKKVSDKIFLGYYLLVLTTGQLTSIPARRRGLEPRSHDRPQLVHLCFCLSSWHCLWNSQSWSPRLLARQIWGDHPSRRPALHCQAWPENFRGSAKHGARLSVTGQHFAGIKQWPKGLLGRGCLHQLLWKYSPMYLCATPLSL